MKKIKMNPLKKIMIKKIKSFQLKQKKNQKKILSNININLKKRIKKKNTNNSMDKIGSVVSNIVNNLFDQNKLEQYLDQLDELDLSDLEGNKIIVNDDINNNTKVIINNKEVNRDIFDPIFNSFGLIFNDEFANNFLRNFPS